VTTAAAGGTRLPPFTGQGPGKDRAVRLRDDTGASAVEYGLLIAAIAGVLVVVLWVLGGVVAGLYQDTCDSVAAKAAPSETC
jgi:pilus assembly protein Flp/PilA